MIRVDRNPDELNLRKFLFSSLFTVVERDQSTSKCSPSNPQCLLTKLANESTGLQSQDCQYCGATFGDLESFASDVGSGVSHALRSSEQSFTCNLPDSDAAVQAIFQNALKLYKRQIARDRYANDNTIDHKESDDD